MAFIDKSDYADVINANVLDDITQVSDAKIDTCEKRAIEYMSGYLNTRYDCTQIFNKTGDDRNQAILGYAKDITLYYLHRLINPRKVPANRYDAYKEAKEWLEGVAAQQIDPPNLPVPDSGDKDYIKYGSNPARTNHI